MLQEQEYDLFLEHTANVCTEQAEPGDHKTRFDLEAQFIKEHKLSDCDVKLFSPTIVLERGDELVAWYDSELGLGYINT